MRKDVKIALLIFAVLMLALALLAFFGYANWETIEQALLIGPAAAEEARVFHDNMELKAIGGQDNKLEISFIDPLPPALREIGVTAGQVLVRGRWVDNILEGAAFVFGPGCAREYPVRGVVDVVGDLIVIGPVPQDCNASSPLLWSKQAVMRFEPVRQLVTTKRKERKKEKEQEKPKPKLPKPKPRPAAPAAPSPYQYYQQQPWQWR